MAAIGFPDILKGFRLWGNKSTTIQPDASQSANIAYTLPPSLPGTKQYLTCDENGYLSWQAIAESLPDHLYYFHAGDCPDSGSAWDSRSGAIANTLSAQNGTFIKTGSGSSAYVDFSRSDWAHFSWSPSLAAFFAVTWFDPPLNWPSQPMQLTCYGSTISVAALGTGNASSDSFARPETSTPQNWKDAKIWANGLELDTAINTTYFEAGAWENWGIILATGSSPLFPYNNIGRDRSFHEFRGKLKALVGLASQPSNDEISAWFSHLNSEFSIY